MNPDANPSPPPTRSTTSSSTVGAWEVWPSTQATALQLWRFVEWTSRSVVATALTRGCLATTLSIMPTKALGSSLDLAATSGPGIPSPFCRSSSLPMRTSTCATICSTTSTATFWPPHRFHSFSRKLRSKLVTAPDALAACIASTISAPVVLDSAAKMPPLWNQRTPAPKMAFQSKSPGASCAAASFARL